MNEPVTSWPDAGVEMDVLEQQLADPLGDAAADLAFEQERVHHRADIVDDAVVQDLDLAGLGVDFEFADMHAVREVLLPGGIGGAGDETRLHAVGQVFRVPRLGGDPAERHGAVGAGNREDPVGEIDVGLRGFEQMRGDGFRLLDDPVGRHQHRRAAQASPNASRRCPRRSRPCRCRPGCRCTWSGWMPSRSHISCLKTVSCPMPCVIEPHSSVAVPPRSKRISAASKPPAAARSIVFEKPKPRSRPRARRFGAARLEPGEIGEFERQVHVLGELAAIVGEDQPGLERHRLGRDRVAAAQFDRVDAEFGGRLVDHALDDIGEFGPAVAAIGPHRVGVREHGRHLGVHRRRAVDPGQGAEIHHEHVRVLLRVGADRGDRARAEGEEIPVAVERQLGLGDMVARLRVATETPRSGCWST